MIAVFNISFDANLSLLDAHDAYFTHPPKSCTNSGWFDIDRCSMIMAMALRSIDLSSLIRLSHDHDHETTYVLHACSILHTNVQAL